jgi:hypothetical protein
MSNTVGLNLHGDAPVELDLHSESESLPPDERTHHGAAWIMAIAFLAAAIGSGYYAYRHGVRWQDLRFRRPVTTTTAAPVATTAPPAALGGTADAIEVPPLDASDAVVRSLVGNLSANPDVAAWLTTNDLIRNFTVVVTNIADGHPPAKHLQALKPLARFTTIDRGGRIEIDPRSYQRYTNIATAVASVDAGGAARLYATLKPRIEEAHRELGNSDPSFDQTLQRAIVALLQTPSPETPMLLQRAARGTGYEYRDGQLESLTAAQRQLLRMGPANVRIVQAKLRDVAAALGIPATALPAH